MLASWRIEVVAVSKLRDSLEFESSWYGVLEELRVLGESSATGREF